MVGAATTGGTVIKGGSIGRMEKPWATGQATWGRGPFYMTIFSLPVTKGPLEFPPSLLGAKGEKREKGQSLQGHSLEVAEVTEVACKHGIACVEAGCTHALDI